MKKEKYSNEIIVPMRNFYRSLSEKDRRRYAAVEAVQFGYGGISCICGVSGCYQSMVYHFQFERITKSNISLFVQKFC